MKKINFIILLFCSINIFSQTALEVIEKADNLVDVALDDAEKIMRLIDILEDLDDVQDVHTNADFSDEVMQQLSA